MSRILTVPELGENVTSAIVVNLLVAPGDTVAAEQPVAELETEKATAELPSPFAGTVEEILVKVGDEVQVGQSVMRVADGGADVVPMPPVAEPATISTPEPPQQQAEAEPLPVAPVVEAAEPSPIPMAAPRSDVDPATIAAAPAARRLAREIGLSVTDVPGSGRGGRISMEDVKEYAKRIISSAGTGGAAAAGAVVEPPLPDFSRWGATSIEPMSGIRRKTAEAMSLSWRTIPAVTQNDRADITELDAFRKRWGNRNTESGAKLTVTAVIIKAVAQALRVFPRFNASVDVAGSQVILKDYVNIGVAVDAGHGLLVPVLRDVDRKSIVQVVDELADMSARARKKKLSLDEMKGANFTISNLGGLGTTSFTPIINWPESAILGVGRAQTEAVWTGEQFEPRSILPLSVSYDHRLNDGADAARFLRWIAAALEEPIRLVMEGSSR